MPINDLHKNNAEKKIVQKQVIDFGSGVFSGMVGAVCFHPWDRATYLSVKHNRPFFIGANIENLTHGMVQTIMQRAFVGSAYYYVQAQMKAYIVPSLRDNLGAAESIQHCATGLAAGFMHGLMNNPVSAVKAHTWGDHSRTFLSSAKEMYCASGYKAFFRGQLASLSRDTIHGCAYEVIRHALPYEIQTSSYHSELLEHKKLITFFSNTVAACVGTVFSAPFNHARTMQFSTPPHEPSPKIRAVLKEVWKESDAHSHKRLGRIRFFQDRFRIGVGTIRGSVGMAVGQDLFERTQAFCNNVINDKPALSNKP